jgi:16S rRNA (uracil1498-N3)-methyltransferase
MVHSRFYAPNLVAGGQSVELPAEEAEHLSRVLRLRTGTEVQVFDGRGHEYVGRVELIERARVVVAVAGELPDRGTEPRVRLVLAQALLKADAMDDVVRDAVMLGVSRIVPLETERCEMPAKRVRASGRVARWRRIAVASAKQCGRSVVPEVVEPRRLDECLREFEGTARYLLAEPALAPAGTSSVRWPAADAPPASALLIVGPEGGWTEEEAAVAAAAGCQPVTLGARTLRADAAAVVGLTALQCYFDDFSVTGRQP